MNCMTMSKKINKRFCILCVLLTLLVSSCGKSLSDVMNEKQQEGYVIVHYDDHSFVYTNPDIICYYDHNKELDSIIYKVGDTEIRLFEPKLEISDRGEIYAIKDFSKNAYEGYLDYYDGPLMIEEVKNALIKGLKYTDHDNKPIFFNKDGFVVTYNSRKFLICPKSSKLIEALLVYDEAGYEISIPDYDSHKFLFNLYFKISDLPGKLQPKFASDIVNIALYSNLIENEDNQLKWFVLPCIVKANGLILEADHVIHNESEFRIPKDSFKNNNTLKEYIENHKEIIINKYKDLIYDIAKNNAHTLEYYYQVFCNKNELQRKYGQTCYIDGVIKGISEKNEDGDYYIRFDYSTFDDIFFFINGYTKDPQIANLHLPAHVILKGTLGKPNGFSSSHLTFGDIELRGIIQK